MIGLTDEAKIQETFAANSEQKKTDAIGKSHFGLQGRKGKFQKKGYKRVEPTESQIWSPAPTNRSE